VNVILARGPPYEYQTVDLDRKVDWSPQGYFGIQQIALHAGRGVQSATADTRRRLEATAPLTLIF